MTLYLRPDKRTEQKTFTFLRLRNPSLAGLHRCPAGRPLSFAYTLAACLLQRYSSGLKPAHTWINGATTVWITGNEGRELIAFSSLPTRAPQAWPPGWNHCAPEIL